MARLRPEALIDVNTYLTSVAKSGRVLYAFAEFYCYFYRLEPSFMFEHFELFGCISAAVYSIDESIENGTAGRHSLHVEDLAGVVADRLLVDEPVTELLADARDYWSFESRARQPGATYEMADVLRMTRIRSFDFRIMHHALLQRAGLAFDQDVFAWFRSFEMLMEIEDDLTSIQSDEERRSYNYYCFVRRLVGRAGADAAVETARADLEGHLARQTALLWERGFLRCAAVFERYRAIVPRRPIGSWCM